MNSTYELDAVVVGAGTAGATAAFNLAKVGRRVALVDARPLEAAGARWVNAVPAWQFERAGVPLPEGEEHRGGAVPVLLPSDGAQRLALGHLPDVLKVDMRLLVERLQRLALEAGALPFPRTQIREVVLRRERPVAVRGVQWGEDGQAREVELRARLFVDASGLVGVLRQQVPALSRHTPAPAPSDVCCAAQQVRAIADRAGAERFLTRVGASSGEALNYLGVAGGFSTLMVSVDLEANEVELLAGALADGSTPSGGDLIRRFRADEPWVGELHFGGQGRIPLRRPYDRFSTPGLALVGNAACQVFPAHGSGIGVGMAAGRILAESVRGHDDTGGLQATWSYQAGTMRELGGLLGAYDVFRRLSQRLSGADIGRLITAGLMSQGNAQAALLQRMPRPTPREGLTLLTGAARAPRLAGKMIPQVARMQAVHAIYRRYPRRPCLRQLGRWSRLAARLHGGTPDVR